MKLELSYTLGVDDERRDVERVLGAVDGIRGLGGAILVLVIAVASFETGGTVGAVLGACLLAFLGIVWVSARRRRA